MQNHDSEGGFNYSYSAKEQEELLRIRNKYMPKEESKLDKLRRLDASAGEKATLVSLIVGIVGTLILGIGMCCCMVWAGVWFVPGIFVGFLGIALLAMAYPLYNRVLKQQREKIAPEILRLSEELMK